MGMRIKRTRTEELMKLAANVAHVATIATLKHITARVTRGGPKNQATITLIDQGMHEYQDPEPFCSMTEARARAIIANPLRFAMPYNGNEDIKDAYMRLRKHLIVHRGGLIFQWLNPRDVESLLAEAEAENKEAVTLAAHGIRRPVRFKVNRRRVTSEELEKA